MSNIKPRHAIRNTAEEIGTIAQAIRDLTVGESGLTNYEVAARKQAVLIGLDDLIAKAVLARIVAQGDLLKPISQVTTVILDAIQRYDTAVSAVTGGDPNAYDAGDPDEDDEDEDDTYLSYDGPEFDEEDEDEDAPGPYSAFAHLLRTLAEGLSGKSGLSAEDVLSKKDQLVEDLTAVVSDLRNYHGGPIDPKFGVGIPVDGKLRHHIRNLVLASADDLYVAPTHAALQAPIVKLQVALDLAKTDATAKLLGHLIQD